MVAKFVAKVFPAVDCELGRWTYLAERIPDPTLRQQALASIRLKKFHAQGGSIYALYPTVCNMEGKGEAILKFIVAFQTISDYLDNLCDRAGVTDEASFRQLHQAMLDAVNPAGDSPGGDLNDYYRYYPHQDDLGYLNLLVTECRTLIIKLPSYHQVQKTLQKQIQLYTDLQALKHLQPTIRQSRLESWAKTHREQYPELLWWEFAAATGSTLGVFLLVAAASDPALTPEEVARIDQAYFPWIDGLHILLDYYIDTEEDRLMNDLNFTGYYQNPKQCRNRLMVFIHHSLKDSAALSYPKFHQTVVQGLLAMYLSDAKALTVINQPITKALLKSGGLIAQFYYGCCRLLRRLKKL